MRKIIGAVIIILVFLTLFARTCIVCGLKDALKTWGAATLWGAIISFGAWLMKG